MYRRPVKQSKPLHEKAQSWATSISLVIIPVVIAVVGNSYTSAQSESKLRTEYIKMGVSLLAEKPTDNNQEVRRWAIELINHYSEVKFKPEAKNELEKNSILLALTRPQNIEEVQYLFKWEDHGRVSYTLEIQSKDGDEWVNYNGLSSPDNKITLPIPANTQLRWRYGIYQSGGLDIVYKDWSEIFVATKF